MPQFFASTSKGTQDVLAEELMALGVKVPVKTSAGAFFECNWEEIYRLNLQSRVASRFIKPVLDVFAYNGDELYSQVFKKHDFTKYINPSQTLMIEASIKECSIHDQRFVAMKVKDAVVDQFRQEFGERPNVDTANPDLRIYVKGYKNKFSLGIDTSGPSLFQRGYRLESGVAPIKENLAAALIYMSGWKKNVPIVDLSCGSGTFLIEAAMMALNMAPGMNRQNFGFTKLKGFDAKAWNRVVEEAALQEVPEDQDIGFKFYGFDCDKKILEKARANARRAGVDHLIEFRYGHIANVKAPVPEGLIIMNPPYGTRIGDEDNLKDVYRDLGHTLKTQFSGWDAWILSGNKDLISFLKLKSSRKFFVYNGALECRFLKYSIT